MNTFRSAVVVAILAGIVTTLALPALLVGSPASVASLSLGTDDAFVTSGLEPRENQIGGGAIRWTRPKATFQFEDVGPGSCDIALVARGHRSEVTLTANGARIGSLLPGQDHFATRVRLSGESLVLGIETDGFAASGRNLGTQFVSLRVEPAVAPDAQAGALPLRIALTFLVVVLVASVTQALSGLAVWVALIPPVVLLLLILPAGLWRSDWLFKCATLVCLSTLVSAEVSKRARGGGFSRAWLQVALLLALTIHGILPPSPLMIQGDAQLHGNKLGEVARGNRFPTSRTDHKPPFDFPYGFSFYGVLTPWAASDALDVNVRVVRAGAAFFSTLSAIAIAVLVGGVSAGLAAASLILWTFSPVNIGTMAFGNLSNVFAQATFVLFLVGAALLRKGLIRAGLLTFLVALSATAHLSSFIVLVTLLPVTLLISRDRHSAAKKPLLAGAIVASAYYACFLPLILGQIPRLLGERGGSAGVFDPWRLPNQIVSGVGWPLLALVVLSLLVGRIRVVLPLSRSLPVTGAFLAVLALVSPIEVRYLLAVMPLLAIVAASVFERDDGPGFPQQSLTSIVDLPWLRVLGSERLALPLATGLLIAAVVHGTRILLEFVPLAAN